MKYSIETTEKGYMETLEINGKKYTKSHEENSSHYKRFCDQLREDGVTDESFLENVSKKLDRSDYAQYIYNSVLKN